MVATDDCFGSRSLTRSVIGPVVVGAVVAMVFAAYDAAETVSTTATGAPILNVPESLAGFVDWLVPAARAIVPISFLVGTLRLRSAGGPLSTMAARLERDEEPGDVDDALAAYIENDELADASPLPAGRAPRIARSDRRCRGRRAAPHRASAS